MQCHKEMDIELPETGVIAFTGNNNNGKSVVTKILKRLISNQFQARPRARASLINRNAQYGEATFVRSDGMSLTLHLTRDAAGTYLRLEVPGEEPVTRYLADKSFPDLCKQFGFHYAPERDITLNVAEADEALLFFATSNACNYDILDTAMSDPVAALSLENVGFVYKQAGEIRDIATNKINTCNTTIASLQIYDEEEAAQKAKELSYYYNILSRVYIPVLPAVEHVPKINLLHVHVPRIPKVVYPPIYNVSCRIPDVTGIAKEIQMLKDKVCPLCGRRVLDGESTHTVCN